MRNFVRSWFAHHKGVPEKFEDVHPDLLPVVRGRRYYEVMRLQLRADGMPDAGCPYRTIAEHLAVGLGYDLPESIIQVREDNLTRWGVTFEQALQAACDNLRIISQEPLAEVGPGVWRSPWRDNHDAARLVLLDYLRRHEVRGDPVVVLPNRDTLLLAGSADDDALVRMGRLTEEAVEQSRFVSGVAVRLEGDAWVPYLPEPGHPAHELFRGNATRSMARDYATQKDALETLYEKTEEDVFVATCSVMVKKETGEVRSYGVWSEGVDSLLPRTDIVALFRPTDEDKGEVIGLIPWEKVWEIAGHLLERVDIYPERYRARQFPNEEQLAALRLASAFGP
jgi:hypothetical protein